MKKLLLLLIPLTLLQAQQGLRSPAYVAQLQRPTAGGGGCATVADSVATGADLGGNFYLGQSGNSLKLATYFVASANATICSAGIYLLKVGSPTFNMKVEIWSYNSGSDIPDTLIGTGSANVAASSVTGSYTEIAFTGISASVTMGTTYCIVLVDNEETTDASNYIQWNDVNTGDPGHNTIWQYNNSMAWVAIDIANLNQGAFKLYK